MPVKIRARRSPLIWIKAAADASRKGQPQTREAHAHGKGQIIQLRERDGHSFVLAPAVALIALIYLFAYVDADFVLGEKGLF